MRKIIPLFCAALLACQPQNSSSQDTANADAKPQAGPYNSAYALDGPRYELAAIQTRLKGAYGGEALVNLKSVRIQTDRGLAWPGQGQTADFVEYVSDKYDVQLDFENQRGSVERHLVQNGNAYHSRTVSLPDGGVAWIDYNNGTFQKSDDAEFLRSFGLQITGSDTLIARALVMDPHEATIEQPAFYLGKWHDRVTFMIRPEGFPGTAYIAQDTGLITRFEVILGDGTWNAVYSDYKTSQGLTYARKRMDIRDDKMLQTDPDRRHSFNVVDWDSLKLERDLVAPSEEVDMSDMTVDRISGTIHHVGQEDYSVFIDAGDHIIALNPNAEFKRRYEAYKKAVSSQKPLRHILITHHHGDHLEGLKDAVDLGAVIAAPPMTIKAIKAGQQLSSDVFHTLKPMDQFGPVKTFTVPTSHAAEYAIIYMEGDKVLYQDDHYYPSYVDGPSYVNQSGLVLHNRVRELGLQVDILLSGHARKAEKWSDFERAAARQTLGDICPRKREICLN